MFQNFWQIIRKIYFSHNIVLWLVMLVLPVISSLFVIHFFSAEIIQHVSIGIVKNDNSHLANKLENALCANLVLEVVQICEDRFQCEHGVIQGNLQAFIEIPYDLERRAMRLEVPVIPVYSSGQNYLTNSIAIKEIRATLSSLGANLFTTQIKEPINVHLHSVGNEEGNYQGFLGLGLVTAIFHLASILAAVYLFSFPFRDYQVREFLKTAGGSRVLLGLSTTGPLVIIQWIAFMAVYVYGRHFLSPMSFDEFIMDSIGELAMILACTGAGVTFVGVAGNMRVASSAAGVVGGPAFAFAGQTFPLMAMPLAVRCFAFILPLTHILKVHSAMLLGPIGKSHAFDSIMVLLVMALFWHLLGSRLLFLRWKVAQEKEEEWEKRQKQKIKDKLKNMVQAIASDLQILQEKGRGNR